MPVSNLPVYGQSPKTATAVVTAAATNLATDAPAGTVLLFQAGPNGAQMTRLSAIPRVTIGAASLLLFLAATNENPTVGGNNPGTIQRLIDSEQMASTPITTTVVIPEVNFANYSDSRVMRLAPFDRVYVASQVAGNIVFKVEYMDF